jgi:hypothetical protein
VRPVSGIDRSSRLARFLIIGVSGFSVGLVECRIFDRRSYGRDARNYTPLTTNGAQFSGWAKDLSSGARSSRSRKPGYSGLDVDS